MATDKQSVALAATWLKGLAELCVHNGPPPTVDKFHQMAFQLCEVLPSGVFTSAAARECAKGDFFPGFDTLQTRLTDWWARHKPGATRLLLPAGVDAGDLQGTDLSWFNFWHTQRPETAEKDDAIRRRGQWTDEAQLPLARLASLIRQQSPRAWTAISGAREATRAPPTEAELWAVRDAVERALAGMQPPRGPYTPSARDQLRAMGGAAAVPARQPAQASPELLEQLRAESPIVQAARAQQEQAR